MEEARFFGLEAVGRWEPFFRNRLPDSWRTFLMTFDSVAVTVAACLIRGPGMVAVQKRSSYRSEWVIALSAIIDCAPKRWKMRNSCGHDLGVRCRC